MDAGVMVKFKKVIAGAILGPPDDVDRCANQIVD
jgi:hypothetical protein